VKTNDVRKGVADPKKSKGSRGAEGFLEIHTALEDVEISGLKKISHALPKENKPQRE